MHSDIADRAAALMRRTGRTILPLHQLAGDLGVGAIPLEYDLGRDDRFHVLRTPPAVQLADGGTAEGRAAYTAALDRAGLGGSCLVVLTETPATSDHCAEPTLTATIARSLGILLRDPVAADTAPADATLAAGIITALADLAAPAAPSTTPPPAARRASQAPPVRRPVSSRPPRGPGSRRG